MTAEEKKAKVEKIKAKYKEFMKVYPLNPQSLIDEIWAWIEGYEDDYQISNYGRVKSLKHGKEKILKPSLLREGYLKVELSLNNNQEQKLIHILVAKAFIPNPENKPQVNHIDSDKFNCCVENLEWATVSENTIHAYKNNLIKTLRGQKKSQAKLTDEQARYCRAVYKEYDKKLGIRALAKKFNISETSISKIVSRKSYKDA